MNYFYRCSECGNEYEITPDRMLCDECRILQEPDKPLRGILEVRFRPDSEGQYPGAEEVFRTNRRPVEPRWFPKIAGGNTPLWEPERLRRDTGSPNLYLKDDTVNPTGSFKDRASYLVAAFARREGIREIILASTGNAGSSMAGVGAAAGLDIILFLPEAAPPAKLVQALQYGARVIRVKGNYDLAYEESMKWEAEHGGLSRNTAYNPLTIEGKKTVSFEITNQLGSAPDAIFVAAGDGVILGGVYKGFADLIELGLINKMPRVFAVQAEGSSAIARAFKSGSFGTPVPTYSIADSIQVDVPKNGYYALSCLKKYRGECVIVTDEEIIKAQKILSSGSGLFAEPAGAAAYAGFLKVREQTQGSPGNSRLNPSSKIVILITGSGLKDIEAAMKGITSSG